MTSGLPLFLTRENKFFWGVVIYSVVAALYFLPNHIHLVEPIELVFWRMDRVTPFLPSTVWIYASEYVFFYLTYIHARDMANLNRYLYALLALAFFSSAIFWIWPTTYPRDMFPLPEDLNAPTYFLFDWLRTIDSPANCCPSFHVSGVLLASLIYAREQRWKLSIFFPWAVAIAASTLTTKQHYLVDVIAGGLLAILAHWTFYSWVPYRETQPNR